MGKSALSGLIGYKEDYHAWLLEQIELLRAERFRDLDTSNLIDELRTLSNMTKREIEHRLAILLQHLLKWQFQPLNRSNSWRATIIEQRYRIRRELADSPSLRRYPSEVLSEEFVIARLRAADETGLPLEQFPEKCPYTASQALDENFWPGGADLKK